MEEFYIATVDTNGNLVIVNPLPACEENSAQPSQCLPEGVTLIYHILKYFFSSNRELHKKNHSDGEMKKFQYILRSFFNWTRNKTVEHDIE